MRHLLLVSHSLLFRLEPSSHTYSACLCNPLSNGAQLLALRKKALNVWSQQNVCGAHFLLRHGSCLRSRRDSFETWRRSAILSGSNCRFCADGASCRQLSASSGVPSHCICPGIGGMRRNRLFLCPPERILTSHQHLRRALMCT